MKSLLTIVALLLQVTACMGESDQGTVGSAAPLSSRRGSMGQTTLKGVKLAVAEGNAGGGAPYALRKDEGDRFRQTLDSGKVLKSLRPPAAPHRAGVNLSVLLTFAVAFLASVLSGMSGGGAGFIMMPYLTFLGLPPMQALATSKLQNLGIAFGAVTAFKGKGLVDRKLIWPFIVISVVGAFCASRVLPSVNAMFFGKAVGILIIVLVPSLFINRKAIEPGERSQKWKSWGFIAYAFFSFLTSLMGAGLGSIIVLVLMSMFGLRAIEAQATKRIPQIVEAVITFVFLLLQGMVVFSHGASGFIGAMAGCYVGTGISIKNGDKFVKVALAITMIISGVVLLWPAGKLGVH